MDNIEKMNQFKQIVNESNDILIVTHIDPDGDAVGSSLALYNYIKDLNKDVDIMIKKCPQNFSYLPRYNEIKKDEKQLKSKYDLILIPDCSDQARVDFDFTACTTNKIIVIDHHVTHIHFGDVTILDSDSPAACQIIFDIFQQINANITVNIAKCIYTGILTDTGGFRYSNVNPHTFEIAKTILEMGINSSEISRNANDIMSHNKFELLKTALNNIEFINGKIAYLYLPQNVISSENTEDNIHEGLVNYGRDVENIEVSVFIRQIGDNEYKVSMRANEYVDVSKIAQKFGGGGHIKAAGISYKGKLEDLKKPLLDEIEKAI